MQRHFCKFSLCSVLTTLLVCGPIVYYLLSIELATTTRYNDNNEIPAKQVVDKFDRFTSSAIEVTTEKDFAKTSESSFTAASIQTVDLLVLFTKAKGNEEMKEKLTLCLKSLIKTTTVSINLHIIADENSQAIAQKIIKRSIKPPGLSYLTVKYYDVMNVSSKLHSIVSKMQKHFSYKPGSYYSDVIFFLSMALHQVFAESHMIMVDIDVMFRSDILELYGEFSEFGEEAVIGIAYEQQPVYKHVFQLYRLNNSEPLVGDPPTQGFPGFNSGVLLLNLDRMRTSSKYKKFLNDEVVDELVRKYRFRGHLGDQDFFTLVGIEHRELFHVLPCGWNRQLCQWWRNHGYESVFDEFYACDKVVKILHGNCNTPIL